MNKWIMPSFLTSLIAMIAIALNERFLWDLEPDKLIASVGLTINFIVVTLAGDIAKIKRGEKPNFNSTKLFTLLFSCVVIGFSEYVGIQLDTESVIWISGVAAAFMTGKGVKDYVAQKKGVKQDEYKESYGGHGPTIHG